MADLLNIKEGLIKTCNFHAAVRSKDQAQSLSKFGINVVHMDLGDEQSVVDYIVSNDSTYGQFQRMNICLGLGISLTWVLP